MASHARWAIAELDRTTAPMPSRGAVSRSHDLRLLTSPSSARDRPARGPRIAGARGARVVLLDPSHPREKPCGGGITGRALALVGRRDRAREPARSTSRSVARGSSTSRTGRVRATCRSTAGSTALVVASRRDFDGLLLDAARRAGADVRRRRGSRRSGRRRGGLRLDDRRRRPCRARSSSAPTAPTASSGDALARPFRRDQLSIATGFFAHGVTSDEIVIELVGRSARLYLVVSAPRSSGHRHLRAGGRRRHRRHAARDASAAWIARTGIARGARLEPYSWPIPSLVGRRPRRRCSWPAPDWLPRRRRRRPGRSDHARRDLLRAAVGGVGRGRARVERRRPSRGTPTRVREEIGAELARAARLKAGSSGPHSRDLMIDALSTARRSAP